MVGVVDPRVCRRAPLMRRSSVAGGRRRKVPAPLRCVGVALLVARARWEKLIRPVSSDLWRVFVPLYGQRRDHLRGQVPQVSDKRPWHFICFKLWRTAARPLITPARPCRRSCFKLWPLDAAVHAGARERWSATLPPGVASPAYLQTMLTSSSSSASAPPLRLRFADTAMASASSASQLSVAPVGVSTLPPPQKKKKAKVRVRLAAAPPPEGEAD